MTNISGVPNWVQNQGLGHFLKVASLYFLAIAQDCSHRAKRAKTSKKYRQALTSSRAKTFKKYLVVKIGVEMIFSILILFELPLKLACFWINNNVPCSTKLFYMHQLLHGSKDNMTNIFWVSHILPTYFTNLQASEIKAKCEKRGKYLLYFAR